MAGFFFKIQFCIVFKILHKKFFILLSRSDPLKRLILLKCVYGSRHFIDNSTSQKKLFYMNRGCLNLKWTCVGSFKKISFKICGGFFSKGTLGGALNMSNFMMSMTKGQASKEFACQIQLTWTSYLGRKGVCCWMLFQFSTE